MSTFLVICHMSDESRRLSMVSYIKENRQWARIWDNEWCIRVDDTATTAEIRDNLNARCPLSEGERLIVINITKSAWASYNLPREVADWLKE